MTPAEIAALPTPLMDACDCKVSPDTNGHQDWKYAYFHILVSAKQTEQDRAALTEALLLFVVPALRAWVDAKKQIEECVDLKGDLQLYAQAAEQDLGDALFVADETLAAVRQRQEDKNG